MGSEMCIRDSIIDMLSDWFNLLGWPQVIRSDNGPQFRREFGEVCETNEIKHETSSPYN